MNDKTNKIKGLSKERTKAFFLLLFTEIVRKSIKSLTLLYKIQFLHHVF